MAQKKIEKTEVQSKITNRMLSALPNYKKYYDGKSKAFPADIFSAEDDKNPIIPLCWILPLKERHYIIYEAMKDEISSFKLKDCTIQPRLKIGAKLKYMAFTAEIAGTEEELLVKRFLPERGISAG